MSWTLSTQTTTTIHPTTTLFTTTTTTASSIPPPSTSTPPLASTLWYNKPASIVLISCSFIIILSLLIYFTTHYLTKWGWIREPPPLGMTRLRGGRNQRMVMELRGIDVHEQGRRDRLFRTRELERERYGGRREWIGGYNRVIMERLEIERIQRERQREEMARDVLPRYEESGRDLAVAGPAPPPPAYEFGAASVRWEGGRYFGGV